MHRCASIIAVLALTCALVAPGARADGDAYLSACPTVRGRGSSRTMPFNEFKNSSAALFVAKCGTWPVDSPDPCFSCSDDCSSSCKKRAEDWAETHVPNCPSDDCKRVVSDMIHDRCFHRWYHSEPYVARTFTDRVQRECLYVDWGMIVIMLASGVVGSVIAVSTIGFIMSRTCNRNRSKKDT